MPDTVHLFVHVPEASRHMLGDHDFPVLVYVDPPDANLTCNLEGANGKAPSIKVCKIPFGSFNAIVRIKGLPSGAPYVLNIQVRAASGDAFACHSCRIRRDAVKRALGGAPTISYPTSSNPVGNNFSSYGYVDPTTATVSVWLADSHNNTYPGIPIQPPPQYDWADSFHNIPAGGYTLFAEADGETAQVSITVRNA